MTLELKLLVWSTALALIQMLVAVLAAIAQVGVLPLVGNRENLPAFEGWAGRAQRAHRNMLESLTIFAALVLVAQFAAKSNAVTALGAQLFFWGRLAYAPVYVVGDSMASHWLVGRFVRRVVANPLANSVGIEAPSGVRSGLVKTRRLFGIAIEEIIRPRPL